MHISNGAFVRGTFNWQLSSTFATLVYGEARDDHGGCSKESYDTFNGVSRIGTRELRGQLESKSSVISRHSKQCKP